MIKRLLRLVTGQQSIAAAVDRHPVRYRLHYCGLRYTITPTHDPIAEDVFDTERAAELIGNRLCREAVERVRTRDSRGHLWLCGYAESWGPSPVEAAARNVELIDWFQMRF